MTNRNYIFLLEHNSRQCQLIGTACRRAGFEIISAPNIKWAILKLNGSRPRACVLSMDKSGRSLLFLRQLKQIKKAQSIPVICLLPKESRDQLREAHALGASMVLEKPIQTRMLINALNSVLGENIGQMPQAIKNTEQRRISSTKSIEIPIIKGPIQHVMDPRFKDEKLGTILLIDDEIRQLRPVRLGLMRSGYSVQTAKDGAIGLQILSHAAPDVIILDLEMPEMNGYEFIHRIKENPQLDNIPVIVLTGRGDYRSMTQTYELGTDLFLNKPVSIKALISAIRRVMPKKQRISINRKVTFNTQQALRPRL